ncbi:sigma-70 family RNA polymerase sigma factor [Arenicella xantha]|uniref:RNA polymerase sigma factor n=1 Tax=Arenicella xantha TaxID=644221 RepID=A0A395JN00_9GAMM|nr:sigma-70 family RNA polymerase sigma factor [Arenicella xantha]RBP53020.1 RNA polymerase sigma-70 factor (ECF subfamily) [Arenicella xantha]
MAMQNDNQQLSRSLSRVSLGDRAEFEKLYRATSPRLLSILLRMIPDRNLSEDLLQEVYIKVWHRAGSYRADHSQAMTWLGSIARYTAIDYLRKGQRQVETVTNEAVAEPLSEVGAELDSDQLQLSRCLNRLNIEQREAIVAAYLGGYTHQELSVKTNNPLGTIKSWIRRGLSSLKECLSQ